MKSGWKRFLSLALCICMVFVLLPNMAMPANAALSGSVSGLRDNGIGLSWSSILSIDAPWIACDTKIEGSVISQTVGKIKIDYTSQLKIENQKGSNATLFFDYVIEQNGGTIKFGKQTFSGSGSFQQQLGTRGRKQYINIDIQSGSTSAATKIRLTNVALVVDKTATATFLPAENGSYTLDGTAVTAKQSKTQSSLTAYHVVATPAAGYQFMGWYDAVSGQYISSSADAKLHIEDACSITAKFAPKDAALFETGWQRFDDLNAAIEYAKAYNQSKITLVSDGAVSGSYTIPSGITLLIPSDEFHPCYTDDPEAVSTAPAAKPFRTLTMQDGSSITLASGAAISVGGRYYAAPGGQTGRVVGTHGSIKMASGSSITVQRGANLYAWGFISGSGAVSVESGGTVHEWYQVLDFRGGTASGKMGYKVFPFSQYAVQNVEVPMTLQAGATENVSTAVYTLSNIHKTSIPFIGDSGMFRLVSGSLTKAYDGAADRIIYTVSGEAQVNSLSLNLAGKNINSKDYVLPLTNNMTVNLTEGSKLTINQTAALLPGVEANIAKNAELKVSPGYSIYIYDTDEWGGYCGTYDAQYIPVPYAPGQTGKRAPLADAKVNVNGTLIADGGIYTTAGGADICSSEGTGVYKQQGAIGSETTTYQYTQQGGVKVHEIPITPAKLHNADGTTYVETKDAKAGDIINYVRGVWGGTPCAHKNTEVRDAKDPTCTAPGYTGDTYCTVCNEKVKEGEAIPAKGHITEIRNQVNPTLTTPGYTGDKYCKVCNLLIEQGKAIPCSTGWLESEQGRLYYVGGEPQKTGWTEIDGQTYYLDPETGYAATGIAKLMPEGATEEARCVFDGKGVFQKDVTGVYTVGNDTYWLNSGIIEEEAGLKRVVKENGEVNYYYFAVQKNLDEREGLTLSAAVKSTVLNGKDCWLHKTNGLALPEWGYYFDENGVILHDEDTGKNGIHQDGDALYYYVDGIKAPAGMIKIGDDYYYANSKGKLIVNQTYYCSRMNGLMKEGTYAFDAEGKLIPGATDKNGIVKDDDGVLRYYVNGKVTYVGLIEIDGDFYYVRSSGEVVTDCVYYISWTHDLKPQGSYRFAANGKLIGAAKNGIVMDDDGVLRYYVNDKRTYAGLIKIGDDYYYVNSKCEVVHDCDYYITWTHDLKPQGKYHFDADGKLTGEVAPLKNGIYEEDGSLYFYRNGERTYAGLIQIDGNYYYVRSTCEVVHDRSYYVYWTHDMMPAGYYNFDSAGRMIMDS